MTMTMTMTMAMTRTMTMTVEGGGCHTSLSLDKASATVQGSLIQKGYGR